MDSDGGGGAGPGHPCYDKLNELLAEAGLDRWVEGRCRPYCGEPGQPAKPVPGHISGAETRAG